MRVLIVDDHPLVVDAVTTAIGVVFPEIAVETASRVEDVVARPAGDEPDLVLLDLSLPGCRGLDALHAVRQRLGGTRIVIFSATQDADTITRALSSGASGFIPKTSPQRVLLDALQLVLHGGTYVPPDILAALARVSEPTSSGDAPAGDEPVEPAMPGRAESTPVPLTERQRQIAELLAEGLTTNEICRRLGISHNTVKTHIASIFRTLGVSNRAQIVAVTHGRLRKPSPQ